MPDTPPILTEAEIDALTPAPAPAPGNDPAAPLREALAAQGRLGPRQLAGRAFPIACVALEITQRCNLDCTLCYLSDRAEAVHDLPLAEVFRRIDRIRAQYGPRVNVQVTGGDPTLRAPDDLEAIVARIRDRGMRSALFTNGIKATRPLLARLAAAGLDDVAFHVDLTQERKGYASEAALNAIRAEYIARARGLGLRIVFNTTVYDGNLGEVAMLARWFRDRAADLTMASFQMQAETGRGTLGAREAALTPQRVMALIAEGAGAELDFDAVEAGHPDCNRAAAILTAGPRTVAMHRSRALLDRLLPRISEGRRDWNDHRESLGRAARAVLRDPAIALHALGEGARIARGLAPGLIAGRGRVSRLSFMIHNFMDARALDRDRCAACVFMTMTRDGPLSMCVHNARRDRWLFAPVPTEAGVWNPATGRMDAARPPEPETLPLKRLKGRLRAAALAEKD